MKDVISVVVPVYNVAAYLPACLDSILAQDYENLEILLIDDGSTDASGEICDEYARKDSRIRVIHQKNAGAAAAKNAGLRAATGKYLSFVDSDDYLEPGAYGYMVRVLEETGADAAQFAFREVYRNREEVRVPCTKREILDSKSYLCRFPKDWTCALLWNKLYRRALYDGVFFEEGHKIDDEYFTYQGFLKPCRVACDGRVVYNYRKRSSGVMNTPEAAERRIFDRLDAIEKRREKVLSVYPDLRRLFDETYLDAIWYLSETPGCGEENIAFLKRRLKNYLTTWGNAFPPRYLWKLLWHLWATDTATLTADCRKKQEKRNLQDYFS